MAELLLPNLRKIGVEMPFTTPPDSDFFSCLLRPSLKSFAIYIHVIPFNVPRTILQTVSGILDTAKATVPNLVEFGLNVRDSELETMLSYPATISSFPLLEELEVVVTLTEGTLEVLSRMPRLRKLTVSPPDDQVTYTSLFNAATMDGFTSLQHLDVVFNFIDDCSAFLGAFAKPVNLKSLWIAHKEKLPFSGIFNSIRDSITASTLQSLTMQSLAESDEFADGEEGGYVDSEDSDGEQSQYYASPMQSVSIEDLQKLFCFGHLIKLHVYEGGPRESSNCLSDDDLGLLGRTWPEMDDLRLPINDDFSPDITHEGLSQYLRANPRLRILHISINASGLKAGVPIRFSDLKLKSISLLEELHLDETSVIPDLSAFGLFLAGVAPNICSIQFYDRGRSNKENDRWCDYDELEEFTRYYQSLASLPSLAEPYVSALHSTLHYHKPYLLCKKHSLRVKLHPELA